MDASSERLVSLYGGLCVPAEPYFLLHRLEEAGFTFRLAHDGVPEVAPFERLGSEDLALLRRWRYHVAMLIGYTPDDRHLYPATATPTNRVVTIPAIRRTA